MQIQPGLFMHIIAHIYHKTGHISNGSTSKYISGKLQSGLHCHREMFRLSGVDVTGVTSSCSGSFMTILFNLECSQDERTGIPFFLI